MSIPIEKVIEKFPKGTIVIIERRIGTHWNSQRKKHEPQVNYIIRVTTMRFLLITQKI